MQVDVTKETGGGQSECDGKRCQTCDCPMTTFLNNGSEIIAEQRKWARRFIDDWGASQAAFATVVEDMNQDYTAYDWDAGQWYEYTGLIWKHANTIVPEIANWIGAALEEGTKAERAKWENSATYNGVESILRGRMAVKWNTRPDLLALQSGYALNTTDAMLDPLTARHHINRYLPANVGWDWDLDKPSVKWANFVDDCLAHYSVADRMAVADYLQTWAGAALTGDANANQAMLFLYGVPGTGKSTFTETLLSLFGSYGASVSGSRVARENNQHPQWLAGLDGKRLVTINEVPARGSWQSTHLNSLIDGGTVEANRMRQDSVNYYSVSHVIATGNHRPTAPTGSGIWRRLRIVKFQAKPTEPNPHLRKELFADLDGVFAWVVQGLERYIENGRRLITPDVIKADTSEYENDADPIRQFLEDHTIRNDDARASVKDLYAAYTAWQDANQGGKALGTRAFANRLNDAGIAPAEPARDNGGRAGGTTRYRYGIGLVGVTQ